MTETIKKQHYSIGELAGILDISQSKIRTMTNDYKVEHTRRGQTRFYTEQQAEEIRMIYNAETLAHSELVKIHLATEYPKTFKRFAA